MVYFERKGHWFLSILSFCSRCQIGSNKSIKHNERGTWGHQMLGTKMSAPARGLMERGDSLPPLMGAPTLDQVLSNLRRI